MPPDEPTSGAPARPASRAARESEPGNAGEPQDEGAGTVVLVLFTAAIFGFATVVTMLGPLLIELSRELDVSLGQAGLLAAAMAVPWALAAPFAGVLSDRFGRRPMIVLALCGLGVVTLGAGLAPSYGVLVALRVLAGLFGGFGPAVAMAAVGDLFPPHRRGMAMGWFNMGFSLAAIVGTPGIGAVGGLLGWRWAFVTTGLLLLVLGLVFRLAFPAGRVQPVEGGVLATYRAVFGVPGLWSVLGANLLERALFNLGVLYLPSFLIISYALDPVTVAPTLVLVAIGSIVGNLVGGWLGDRLPKAAIFVLAQVAAGAIALALFTLPVGLTISAVGGALFGLVNATSRPALLALGTELSARHRGALLGILSVTNQGGIVLGSSLGGLAIGLGGYGAIAITMFGGGALASTLALPLLRRGRPAHPHPTR
jgi:predicted MFS family arabinose efflux permease